MRAANNAFSFSFPIIKTRNHFNKGTLAVCQRPAHADGKHLKRNYEGSNAVENLLYSQNSYQSEISELVDSHQTKFFKHDSARFLLDKCSNAVQL